MKLLELQRTMARAVMQPLTPSERMQKKAPDGKSMRAYAGRFIKPNDRLTSFERLEIYNRQYWLRLLASMMEDFPGLRSVLGARRFEAMCKAYLVDCPSRSFTLRNLGSRLEAWLREHPQWAGVKSVPWNEKVVGAFDLVLIATKHKSVDYQQLADWAPCVVDTRNAMAGVQTKPGQVWKA